MSHTRTSASRRKRFGRVVAVTAVASLATAGSLLSLNGAFAASTVSTITAVSPHLVSAATVNQVITVTGTGFDEASITGVTITGAGACATDPSYIVASSTTLVLKTAGTDCTAGAATITVTDAGGTAVNSGAAAQLLTFVAAPTIVAASATVHPVTTNGAAGLAYANQTTKGVSASTKGGTVIRVTSGAVGFATSVSLPLSATLGGVALTGITKVGAGAGNYFTGVVGAHATDAAPVLRITNNGVSKSFAHFAAGISVGHDFTYAGSTITVSPAYGVSSGGNKLTIAGAGFSTTPASNAITVGGVACPVGVYTATATSIACTVPVALTPFEGPVTVQVVVTGGTALTSTISSGSTYTYVAK